MNIMQYDKKYPDRPESNVRVMHDHNEALAARCLVPQKGVATEWSVVAHSLRGNRVHAWE